jgi:hypothetical protein
MQPLSAAQLLDAWERGRAKSLPERALLLLAAACPLTPAEELGRLRIGQRDARLLTLREWTFGSCLVGLANCPDCGERVEAAFDAADIRAAAESETAEVLALGVADHAVRFRLPSSLDLLAVAASQDLETARRTLFERCLVAALRRDEPVAAAELPTEVVQAVMAGMAAADPQADVQLALSCPACGRQWLMAFDIVAFFWSEVQTWAQRILREVHVLATAYGWREADILALSPQRRQIYLDMVSG